jgi:hypothetical protein
MVEDDDDSFTLLLEIFNNWSTVLLSSSRRRRGKIDLQDFILHTAKQTLAGGTGYARTHARDLLRDWGDDGRTSFARRGGVVHTIKLEGFVVRGGIVRLEKRLPLFPTNERSELHPRRLREKSVFKSLHHAKQRDTDHDLPSPLLTSRGRTRHYPRRIGSK